MQAPRTYTELAAKWLVGWFRVLAFIGVGILIATLLGYPEKDATDPADGRSGLALYTDAGTGCQYLGRHNSLIQRFDADGRQVGCRR